MRTTLDLTGEIALVTGASGGIGASICETFKAAGAKVAGWGRSMPTAGHHNYTADLGSDEDVAQAAAKTKADLGAPSIVVHAGAMSVHGGTLETPPADYANIYNVNVIGAVRLAQAFVPDMQQAGRGNIILISSINAQYATPTLSAYAASKGGLNQLMQTLALELAPSGIRVNVLSPASIDTPLLQSNFDLTDDPDAARAANVQRHPMGRLGTAQDVADMTLFLAAEQSSWVTGVVFPLDGGASVTRR